MRGSWCRCRPGRGERGDYVVVDDPHSVDQAESDVERPSAVEWWNGSMATRLNHFSTGHKAVIMQRLHASDFNDGSVACWDAKFTYWAARPNQLDPSIVTLFPQLSPDLIFPQMPAWRLQTARRCLRASRIFARRFSFFPHSATKIASR